MKSFTFLIMAGGTGGHIFPGLAVACVLKEKGHKVVWLGAALGMETTLVPKYNIRIETLNIKGIRGNGLKRKLMLPLTLSRAILQAKTIIKKHQVDVVLGFGGFASFPGGIAAKLLGKPLIVHEQNAIAGLSNKILAKIATRALYAFPNALPYPDGLVGNPVRMEIAALPPPNERFAHRLGGLNLLVVGGSLGAQVFNEKLPEALSLIKKKYRPQKIVHQAGRNKAEELKARYAQFDVDAECVEFIDDMIVAYAEADLVLCRSGALTVAELAAAGVGSILVPFPFAVDDHQTLNAQYLVAGDAAQCIAQTEFTARLLSEKLFQLDRKICLQWANNARALALPNAATIVADVAIQTAGIKST